MRSRSYVIVAWPESGGPARSRGTGRHRLGNPGTVRRHGTGPRRRPLRRGRHRRPARPSTLAARYGSLVVVLGTIMVSGWFAASGAAAFAQMVQP